MRYGSVRIVAVALLFTAACTTSDPPEGPSESSSPSESETSDALDVDYSELADEMWEWEDICDVTEPDLAIAPFEFSERELRPSSSSNTVRRLTCYTPIWSVQDAHVGDFTAFIDVLDSNIEAVDHYGHHGPFMNDRFHSGGLDEPDARIDLRENSAWVDGEITTFEEPGQQVPNDKGVYAVVLGDFYVLTAYYHFDPDTALRVDCEPPDSEDCLMTAAELAEFLAEDYLEVVYESIETKLGRM